jgi:hypothetical protein
MVTYQMFQDRFPEFITLSEGRFNLFLGDSVLTMGSDENRWIEWYDVAQANLIAHLLACGQGSATGDASPMKPLRSTDVDDVLVEFAVAKETSIDPYENYDATVYGQAYTKWRNMAFAGPRVVF